LLLVLCSIGFTSAGIIDIINGLIRSNLDKLNAELINNIPDSYGACSSNNPPAPCMCGPGCGNLYFIHKSWLYEAYARWITGLRSINVTSIVFSDVNNVVTVDITGYFGALPLSLWIGECLTFDQCVELWDNTDGCCGSDKNFQVNITVDCQNNFPYLNNIKLQDLALDKFEITEQIIGINVDVQDITNTIEATVSGIITTYITNDAFINYNGTMVTLLGFANAEIESFTHGAFICPPSEKKAELPLFI